MTGYRLAPDAAWVEAGAQASPGAEPRAVAARVPDGPPLALHGSSAVVWACALEGGDTQEVITRVAELTGEDRSLVAGPVSEFLSDLVALGLLVLT